MADDAEEIENPPFDQIYRAEYLDGCDIEGTNPTVTIARVVKKNVVLPNGKIAERAVFTLVGKEKKLVGNQGFVLAVRILLGTDETRLWVGKRLTLTADDEYDPSLKIVKRSVRVLTSPDATPENAKAYAKAYNSIPNKRGHGGLARVLKPIAARMKGQDMLVKLATRRKPAEPPAIAPDAPPDAPAIAPDAPQPTDEPGEA